MGAITLVAALVLGVIAFATVLRPGGDTKSVPGEDGGQTPAPRTPPFGAQIIGMDGRVIERIPAASDGYGLRLSPDGTTIGLITPGTVSAVGVDDTGPTTLIQGIANNQGDAQDAVSWSPDGSKIAYVDDGDIYVMNADGSNTRRLTTDPKGDFYPAWSPDGSTIADWNGSTSGVDGGPEDSEIYTIPPGPDPNPPDAQRPVRHRARMVAQRNADRVLERRGALGDAGGRQRAASRLRGRRLGRPRGRRHARGSRSFVSSTRACPRGLPPDTPS